MRQRNQKLTPQEKDALKGRIFDQLGLPQPVSSSPERPPAAIWRWMAAAAVLILLSVPAYLLLRERPAVDKKQLLAWNAVRTGQGETRRIILPDSSVVMLNAESVLSWPADFSSDTSRQVSLTGNAFFSVRKRPQQRNFTVHTQSLAIAVLGTEFNVNARTGATEVALVKGKVNVTRSGTSSVAAVLHPGEKIRLDTGNSKLIQSAMNSSLYSAWTENKWNFTRTRLDDILSLVQAYYGVKPVFENERRRGLKITASITVGSLGDLVAVIENTLQIRIIAENNQLLVL